MDVRITNGIVRGITEQGCLAFKGIPFAKPPVGDLRFQPPQPCDDWFGALDCTRYGPRPIQTPPPWCLDRDSAVYGEDCLNLNVWTPAADGKKRPVLFNIFGGGHMEGSNSELGSEGWRLVGEEDIVFVAPNYRVGALGYLYLPHLLGDTYAASGNLGLLDLILALHWTRENVAHFGGDPDRITLVGQSAGGKSVMDLLLAPAARGLFHGAFAMSGAWQSIKSIETERYFTSHFLRCMGLEEAQAAALLTCPPEQLRQAQEEANKTFFKAESYGATADGIVLPLDVTAAAAGGGLASVPVVLGHERQELYPLPDANPDMDEETAAQKFRWKFGANWERPYALYKRLCKTRSPALAYGEAATEYTYADGCRRAAALLAGGEAPLWLYRWDYDGGLTACHSSDNEALFGRTHPEKRKRRPADTALLDRQFRRAVLSFVQTGVPSVPDAPAWEPCNLKQPMRMLFDVPCRMEHTALSFDTDFPLQVFRLE